ncbi:ADP-ribosylglycohydrolase family protein [Camelimonas fluminis]|uniref:protein-tyrosine-phosphatase n=1 Tax=Camelimonas fluminis TaxID=1576911 RepID=A0ABV7UHX3_9HYPH|nr:ADP-ribosylglycohydrolase family protein [Camelimonas fluminis]
MTHPLLIAEVSTGEGLGRIGITFCPGKSGPSLFGGAWRRDLGIDLEVIRDWGAATIVSLIEDYEFEMLGVPHLGDEARKRHMQWLHLPVRDVSVPAAAFEAEWTIYGEALRSQLRNGHDVLVHCRGGLGRAGTIAARLLVEMGHEPSWAIGRVRSVRRGAIETAEQEQFVLKQESRPEREPSRAHEAVRDRARGALIGLAVGDAVGTTLEFCPRDTYPPLQGMIGGGPFGLQAGEWTDDTAMALALADCLKDPAGFSEYALMRRFEDWYERGDFSCRGVCFDIGITTVQAIHRWKSSGQPQSGSTDPMTAGNGSLMRLAPVAIRYWKDRTFLRDIAARQSRVTHAAPEAVDACVYWAELLADAIEGKTKSSVFSPRDEQFEGRVAAVARGSWRFKRRDEIRSGGYVIDTKTLGL